MKKVIWFLMVLELGILIPQIGYSATYADSAGVSVNSYHSHSSDSLNGLAWGHFARTDSNAFYVVKDTTKVDHIKNFPTIQEAIDSAGKVASATSPCVVKIEPGVWVIGTMITDSNYVSLEGYGAQIVPSASFSGDPYLFSATNVTFEIRGIDFEFTNNSDAQTIYLSGGNVIMRDVIAKGRCDGVYSSGNVEAYNCKFEAHHYPNQTGTAEAGWAFGNNGGNKKFYNCDFICGDSTGGLINYSDDTTFCQDCRFTSTYDWSIYDKDTGTVDTAFDSSAYFYVVDYSAHFMTDGCMGGDTIYNLTDGTKSILWGTPTSEYRINVYDRVFAKGNKYKIRGRQRPPVAEYLFDGWGIMIANNCEFSKNPLEAAMNHQELYLRYCKILGCVDVCTVAWLICF